MNAWVFLNYCIALYCIERARDRAAPKVYAYEYLWVGCLKKSYIINFHNEWMNGVLIYNSWAALR